MAEITREQQLKLEIYDILEKEAILQVQFRNMEELKQKKMDELNALRRSGDKNEKSVENE